METLMDFQTTCDNIITSLRFARLEGLLNEEGLRTYEAIYRLSEIAEFHDDFKSYVEDEDVKEVFKKYNDCRKVRSAESFLNRQI